MGLDSFIFNKNHFETKDRELYYARKYYELDNWIRWNCKQLKEDSDNWYIITKENLKDLKTEIDWTINTISKLPLYILQHLDDVTLSEKEIEIFDLVMGKEFNPMSSNSFNAGDKLLELYYVLPLLYDNLTMSDDKDDYYLYLSSY